MAGILYLYRLLIYLAEKGSNPEIHSLLCLMSRRLYRYITVPAMIASFVGGLGMIYLNSSLLLMGWLHVKLTALLFLVISTLYAGHLQAKFALQDPLVPTSKTLRFLNEVPTLLMMLIVAMAVFKFF